VTTTDRPPWRPYKDLTLPNGDVLCVTQGTSCTTLALPLEACLFLATGRHFTNGQTSKERGFLTHEQADALLALAQSDPAAFYREYGGVNDEG
jgi:hypothetical protein